MVSQREGHTSGVRDLFFQTHLSNCRAAAGGSEFPFCERLFSKVLPVTHANRRCHIFLESFSWLACFGTLLSSYRKKNIEQTTLQTRNIAACLGRQDIPDRTEEIVAVSFPELLFRAPTKNRALSPQSWEGEGGPWMKGRAGTMVNHRVKHAARGWGQAARHHRERKGSPAQRHCFSSNGKLPLAVRAHAYIHQQGLADQITAWTAWKHSHCVTAVVSPFSQQFICPTEFHCHGSDMYKIQNFSLFFIAVTCNESWCNSKILQYAVISI